MTYAFPRYLSTNPHVAWVSYLGLPEHQSHQRALTTLRRGAFGGVLNFGVKVRMHLPHPFTPSGVADTLYPFPFLLKGSTIQAGKVVDLLRLASNLANVGASLPLPSSRGIR
jgi:O-acetylhomoserine/O-acetylserine sulfhydrylase